MPDHLSTTSLDWSIAHHRELGDTDLFPRQFEIDVIATHWDAVREHLIRLDLRQHVWSKPRRVLVPKDHLLFRSGSQLHPIDSLIYAALIREAGHLIEDRRIPRSENKVFSSRFEPQASGQLYSQADYWSQFWSKSLQLVSQPACTHVVTCDIADFYQQLDHGVLRSQLELANVPAWCRSALAEALRVSAGNVGRGVPIGPHPSHLLAELALVPLDNMLWASYPRFCRFIDDIHVFCTSEAEAYLALYDLANVLDGTLHLWTSGRKTKLLSADEFRNIATGAVERGDLSDEENRILEIVQDLTDSPYDFASFDDVADQDLGALDSQVVGDVLDEYLKATPPDFPKVRWFLRRLAQIGAPGAIEFVASNVHRMTPAMPDVIGYLRAAAPEFTGDWTTVGSRLIEMLTYPIVERSEYLQLVILSLFGQIAELDHFNQLTTRFDRATAFARREIILAARSCNATGWLEANASTIHGRTSWEARAVLFAATSLTLVHRRRLRDEASDREDTIVDALLSEQLVADEPVSSQETPRHSAPALEHVQFLMDVEKQRGHSFDAGRFQEQLRVDYQVDFQKHPTPTATFEATTTLFEPLLRAATNGAIDALVRRCHGKRLLNIRMVSTNEFHYDYVRHVPTKPEPLSSISTARTRQELKRCDVLIVTTTSIERDVLLTYLRPPTPRGKVLEGNVGQLTYRVGRFGLYRSACVETKMGSQHREGSALTILDAIDTVAPKAVLVLGIAFGIDRAKYRLGDVLVAESVEPYENQKIGPKLDVQRGTSIPCGVVLAERFRMRSSDWRFRRYDGYVGMFAGAMLSGEKLVNNLEFRDRLKEKFPGAIGGDMEGIGAYAAANRRSTEIILIKGICDWADGQKNDVAQPFAGHAAVSLASHVLSKTDVLKELGAVEN
jgi:nucleoside phosphorylase